MNETKKLFHGWVIVGLFFIMLLILDSVSTASHFFLSHLLSKWGSDYKMLGWISAVAFIPLIPASLIIGKLVDVVGARKVMLYGCVIAGVGTMLFAAATRPWHLSPAMSITEMGIMAATGVAVLIVLMNWFKRRRGLAIGLAMAGGAIGRALFGPISSMFPDSMSGARVSVVVLGLVTMAITVMIVLFYIKNQPSEMGLLPDGDESGGNEHEITIGHTLGKAFRTPAFWFVVAGLFLANGATATIDLYSSIYLSDILNYSASSIGTVNGFARGFSIVGLLAFGLFADRWGPRGAFVLSAVMIAIGIAILASPSPFWIMALYVVPYGLAQSAPSVLTPMIVTDCHGLSNFGFIYTVIGLFASLGTILFTPIGPLIYGYTNSYRPGFAVAIILALLSGYCMYMAKPQKREGREERATD